METLLPPSLENLHAPPRADQVRNSTERAPRVLVMGKNEDGSPKSLLDPFAKVTQVDTSGKPTKVDGDDRIAPEPGEHPQVAPKGYKHLGNHQNLDPTLFESAEEAVALLSNKNYDFSPNQIRKLLGRIKNRTKRILARAELVKLEPKKPRNLTTVEFQERKPSKTESPVSVFDFRIDINKLERARKTLVLVADVSGIEPDEPGYQKTVDFQTRITLDEMEDYLQGKVKTDKSDKRFDKFLFTPQLKEKSKEQEKSTRYDKSIAWLQIKLGQSINEGRPWSIESLDSADNSAAIKDINETVGNGPDNIIRLLMKYTPNEHEVLSDSDGKPISEAMVKQREKLIDMIRLKPEYIHALLSYETTKRSPEEVAELVQEVFDLSLKAGIDENLLLGHMIGYFYEQKVKGNAGKNSNIVHPIKRYQDGALKGMEIWKTVPVEDGSSRNYLEDVEGDPVHPDKVITDPSTGKLVHFKLDEDDGSIEKDDFNRAITVDIAMEKKRRYNAQGDAEFVWQRNPDGTILEKDVIDEKTRLPVLEADGATVRKQKVVVTGPVEYMKPEVDESRLILGPLRIKEWATELGDRFKAGEFMFESVAMADLLDKVTEIGEMLDLSYAQPGFVERHGYVIDRVRGRTNKKRPTGRKSQDYREALFALNKLWFGLSQNLKQSYPGSEDDDSSLTEVLRQQMAMRELDPRFYQGSGTSNQFLKEVVTVIDSLVARHPAAKIVPAGDMHITGQEIFKV